MQYIYTQEEHDRIKTDKEQFNKEVALAVEWKLKEARGRTAQVIEDFFKHRLRSNSVFDIGVPIDYKTLKMFSDKLREANQLPKESCDKDTGTVIQ